MPTTITLVRQPTGDSAVEFTPSEGTDNYACVLLPNDGKYVYSGLLLDTDLYTVEAAPATADGVDSIALHFTARHNAMSGTFKLRAVAKLGAAFTYGAEKTIDVADQYLVTTALACPDGGAWDLTKYAAATFGFQASAMVAGKSILVSEFFAYPTFTETTSSAAHDAGNLEMTEEATGTASMAEEATAEVRMAEEATAEVEMAEEAVADVRMAEEATGTVEIPEE